MSIGGQNILFLKIIHILVNAQSAALRPKGAQHTPIIDIYLSSVGRIYPIPEYICPLLAKYIQYQNISANCWQNISNTTVRGPTVRGPNCPGPNSPKTGEPITRRTHCNTISSGPHIMYEHIINFNQNQYCAYLFHINHQYSSCLMVDTLLVSQLISPKDANPCWTQEC